MVSRGRLRGGTRSTASAGSRNNRAALNGVFQATLDFAKSEPATRIPGASWQVARCCDARVLPSGPAANCFSYPRPAAAAVIVLLKLSLANPIGVDVSDSRAGLQSKIACALRFPEPCSRLRLETSLPLRG